MKAWPARRNARSLRSLGTVKKGGLAGTSQWDRMLRDLRGAVSTDKCLSSVDRWLYFTTVVGVISYYIPTCDKNSPSRFPRWWTTKVSQELPPGFFKSNLSAAGGAQQCSTLIPPRPQSLSMPTMSRNNRGNIRKQSKAMARIWNMWTLRLHLSGQDKEILRNMLDSHNLCSFHSFHTKRGHEKLIQMAQETCPNSF